MYHVMSRGNRREAIFLDDVDRYDFLKTLAEACQKTEWQVHAYCLMGNHYHLVLETPNANLVAGMRGSKAPTPSGLTTGTSSSVTS
jgi:REP element-mobilizing transposase RayT